MDVPLVDVVASIDMVYSVHTELTVQTEANSQPVFMLFSDRSRFAHLQSKK